MKLAAHWTTVIVMLLAMASKLSRFLAVLVSSTVIIASARAEEVMPQDGLPRCAAVYATLAAAQQGPERRELQAYAIQILHRALAYTRAAPQLANQQLRGYIERINLGDATVVDELIQQHEFCRSYLQAYGL